MNNTERKFLDAYDFGTIRKNILENEWHKPRNIKFKLMLDAALEDIMQPNCIIRAQMVKALFEKHEKFIHTGDLIAGSVNGLYGDSEDEVCDEADSIVSQFGFRKFKTNADHFAPNYERFLRDGIPGTLENIANSKAVHSDDPKRTAFLEAMELTLIGFKNMILGYANAADQAGRQDIAEVCYAICERSPQTFREALQLVAFVLVAFLYEGRKAQALGRMDQYLYPYFAKDIKNKTLEYGDAVKLLQSTFLKCESDIINIAIAGVKPEDGSDATNALSYCILEAVGRCNIPGPNLSARLHNNIDPQFVDEALKVIGTGLGYPALMNDEVNIPALHRHGYTIEDTRNYCMVGCIENFIQGKQPPWTDGRINTPKYLEYALNNGCDMRTGQLCGVLTGDVATLDTMDKLMDAFKQQMVYGTKKYVLAFNNENQRPNPESMTDPFLSLFCDDCIGRGLDINNGGALYPSVHGACGIGIATISDSLAAIEKIVYNEKYCDIETLAKALIADFEGYEELQQKLLAAPKYGNDDDFVDKYAVWFVRYQDELFAPYRTRDGGAFYTAIASNTSNIGAGLELAATPDGRKAGAAVSDAASPAQGRDLSGPTAAALSLSKPDYSLVSCGTVVNQKYSPEMFTDPEKRARLGSMILTYFRMGGQEIQINSISRDVLKDAMDNPDNYRSLVVRVAGFSAYYTGLDRSVQLDILRRTEHE